MKELLRLKIEKTDPELREIFLLLLDEIETQQRLRQEAIAESQRAWAAIQELAEAQKRTEAKVAELAEAQKRTEAKVAELAEAQKRTEAKVAELAEAQKRTEAKVAELAEAQKRTEAKVAELAEAQKRMEEEHQRFREETKSEFERVWTAIRELTEAQKRTEAKVAELAEAQKRTEAKVAELAEAQKRTEEAQKRTEEEVRKLAIGLQQVQERLEGISNSVGYTLEDRAMRSLPTLLSEHGIEVEGRLVRRYVLVGDIERQVNIFGHGKQGGERVLILGESKVRPSRKEIDRFIDLAERLGDQEGLPTVLLFVAYDFHPEVEAYLREKSIIPIWSYELTI